MGLILEDIVSVLGKRSLPHSCRPDNDDERGETCFHPPPHIFCRECPTTDDTPGQDEWLDLVPLGGGDGTSDSDAAVTPSPGDYGNLFQVCSTTDSALEQNGRPDLVPFGGADGIGGGEAAVAPTPDDYANLLFCESSEEEETRAALARTTTAACNGRSTSQPRRCHRRQKKHRKSISFGAAIPTCHLLHDVPPAHAMTPDERSALWFGRAELADLKASARLAMQDLRRRVAGDAALRLGRAGLRARMRETERALGSSVRGLERGAGRRRRGRRAAVRDVLACQAHADGLSRFCPGLAKEGLLARVSSERSRKARASAFVDAKHDYDEACALDDAATVDT